MPNGSNPTTDSSPELSSVEKAKLASNYLRGGIAEELANAEDSFTKETSLVLKHHGMYQQDDRDLRGARGPNGEKLDRVYSLMVRTKIPGGRAVGKYAVYLGGRLLGDRLGFLYADRVPLEEVVPLLARLFMYFKHEHRSGETFGDFCHRKGAEELSPWGEHCRCGGDQDLPRTGGESAKVA